ncbi:unnamed protein product [Acanthoscelides obtectus]|uniref:F-box domain-containing protein n=2 Tax=Acanthoscelides obtectus TaxID=200917 RepID=A0A9P0P6N5_ACAOB|nr:unnamed protein product [Acanthoscelides obtectus]CAK1666609.1 F-box/LRR-repeat protein 4 [Acanthoscelides obtectus]
MDNLKSDFVPAETLIKMYHLEQYVHVILDYTSRYNNSNSSYYSPFNLIGKYEIYPFYGDYPETYFLRSYGTWWKKSDSCQSNYRPQDFDPLGAEDYVTVEFESAVVPRDICIYETYNPGAVVRIWGKLASDTHWVLLWRGHPQQYPSKSRKFHPKIRPVNQLVNVIRLEFNQSHLQYHYSVDAILLGGFQPVSDLYYNMMERGLFFLKKPEEASKFSDMDKYSEFFGEDYFVKLPYEVMIHIFQYLDLKSLCRCARVNKRWNEIVNDPFLYQTLSLKPYWYLVNCNTIDYFMKKCTSLKKLDISWCGNDIEGFDKKLAIFIGANCDTLTHCSLSNCKYISREMLTELSTCRNLVDLRLKNVTNCFKLDNPSLQYLDKLVTLDLTATNIEDGDLICILKENPNLKHLIIDLCEHLTNLDIVVEAAADYNPKLTCWSSWKTLSLTAEGVKKFGKFPLMKELDLGWCLINKDPGDCLRYIVDGCPHLSRLILSEWRGLNDHLIIPLIMTCKELTQLDIFGIKNITAELCEKALLYLPKLRLLDISFCDSIRQDEVEILRRQYPHITIQRSCQYSSMNYLN